MQSVSVDNRLVYPSKILCVGRNYVAHIQELGNAMPDAMVVFFKPNSAITQTLHSRIGEEVLHYEGELAFTVENGRLAAVGFGLDLTKRALQSVLKEKGLPWERAKAFDGAALFSPFVPLPEDLTQLSLRLTIDGQERQAGGVDLMIHTPEAIVRDLATFTTLQDGDIIMTGTPAGVGEVRPGQRFTGEVLLAGQSLVSTTWEAQ